MRRKPDYEIVHARDLKDVLAIEWLVEDMIPANSLGVLYGTPGSGKSFLVLDMALQVAQRSAVVYVAAEGERGYRSRIRGWCQHHGKNEGGLYLCLGPVDLMNETKVMLFAEKISHHSCKFLVIDTLATSMVGGDENSTKDMGIVLDNCRFLQEQLRTAVLLVHHTGKNGTSERGSSVIRGSADVMIRVSPADGVTEIEAVKMKDAVPFKTRYAKFVTVELPDGGSTLVPIAAEPIETMTDNLTPLQLKVLNTLSTDIFRDGMTMEDISEFVEAGRGTVWKPLNRLYVLGYVHKPGRSYAITDKGLKRLGITPSEKKKR